MRLARVPFKGADSKLTIHGAEYALASGKYWVPPKEERSGHMTCGGRILSGVPSMLFYKRIGWVKREDTGRYVAVYRLRILPLLVLGALAVCAMWGLAGKASPHSDSEAQTDTPSYIAGETTKPAKTETKGAAVAYAAYESVTDQNWKANALEQSIRLALPGTVTGTDGKSTANPVDAAPHIYVDLNGDEVFDRDECVYNALTYDADGNVESYGLFLHAGTEVNEITLTRPLDAGEYDAELVWTGIMQSDHTPANPMTFQFKITVS